MPDTQRVCNTHHFLSAFFSVTVSCPLLCFIREARQAGSSRQEWGSHCFLFVPRNTATNGWLPPPGNTGVSRPRAEWMDGQMLLWRRNNVPEDLPFTQTHQGHLLFTSLPVKISNLQPQSSSVRICGCVVSFGYC